MPPKSGYRYRYNNGSAGGGDTVGVASPAATPKLSPLHQRRTNQQLEDVNNRSVLACTPVQQQLRPRLPRTSISKIPRHIPGGAEACDSAPSSITTTPLQHRQQQQLQEQQEPITISPPSSVPYHQIESSDEKPINNAKSRYLTFSKDQATSHIKQLHEELSASANAQQQQHKQQRQQPTHSPQSSPVLRRQRQEGQQQEKKQDHQQMTIDISDRQPHRHFRRRRDEQQLITQVDNVYDNLLPSECKAAASTITSQKFRRGETPLWNNEQQQQQDKAQLTSPLVRPRPLDRLSKQQQQVIVDSVMHDDKCSIDQYIDVVGLHEGDVDDFGSDKGGVCLQRQVAATPQASTRLTDRFARQQAHQLQQQQQQQQPICEAFIMTGQSMLKLSCNETENSNNQKTKLSIVAAAAAALAPTTHTTAITTSITNENNDNHARAKTTSIIDPQRAAANRSRESTSLITSDECDNEQNGGLIAMDKFSTNNNININSNINNNEYCVSVRTTGEAAPCALGQSGGPENSPSGRAGDISCNKEADAQREEQDDEGAHLRPSRADEQAGASERASDREHEQRLFSPLPLKHEHGELEQLQQQRQTSEQSSGGEIFEHIELLHHIAPAATRAAMAGKLDAMDSSQEKTPEQEEPMRQETEAQAPCHDRESARRLAKRLYNLSGFKRSDVCHHLAKNNPFSQMVAEEYLCLFDFRSIKLDAALRKFLSKLQLNGETQERERVLSQFSQRYFDCNKEKFPSSDTIQTLVCAMILLNTDLHGNHFDKKLKRNKRTKLSLGAFIDGLNNSIASEPGQCGNGQSANLASQISASNINPVTTPNTPASANPPYTFPRHLLVDLYESIKKRPLKCGEDKCDMTSYEAELDRIYSQQLGMNNSSNSNSNSRSSTLPTRRFAPGSHAPSSTLSANSRRQLKQGLGRMSSSEIDFSIEFKSGFLNRKRTFEAHRKPTSKGRRGWRRIFVILKDLRLIIRYNQEEQPSSDDGDKQQQQQQQLSTKMKKQMIARDMKNTIKLHHAFAKRLSSYTKREYVFQVLFADQSEMLMQASNEQEMDAWIDTINFASACLSSPALPTAVSNSKRYLQRYQARSILPASYTKLSYWEQLIDHEERLQRLKQELEDHLNEAPNTRNADKRSKSEFIERIAYLRLDIERYAAYVDLMRKKSNSPEAIILSKHPQIASLTPSDEMIQNLPSFAPPKLAESPATLEVTGAAGAL